MLTTSVCTSLFSTINSVLVHACGLLSPNKSDDLNVMKTFFPPVFFKFDTVCCCCDSIQRQQYLSVCYCCLSFIYFTMIRR